MSQPVILKIYADLWPVAEDALKELEPILAECLPEPDHPVTNWHNDLLTLAFEGIYFPTPEVLAVLKNRLVANSQGKLDVLDLENWRLERTFFQDGSSEAHSVPLNNVLDYSGY